jgi:hypothetical protein
MVRSVFAAVLASAMLVGPAMALAQTDMVTYGDTLRKKSGPHSAVHSVARGSAGAKHGSGGKHTASSKHTTAKHAAKGHHRR